MLGMFPQTWALPKVGKVQGEHFSWRKATGKGYRLPHPSPTPIDQYSNFMHIFNLNLKSKVYCQLPPHPLKKHSDESIPRPFARKTQECSWPGPSPTLHAFPLLLEHLQRCSVYAILHSMYIWMMKKSQNTPVWFGSGENGFGCA